MKTLRRLSVAGAFALALTIPAFAGQIETMVVPPQPAQTATTAGQIDTGVTGQAEMGSSEATSTDSATETALNLLQSVLSFF
jgi:ATP phosphoribosyltransferase